MQYLKKKCGGPLVLVLVLLLVVSGIESAPRQPPPAASAGFFLLPRSPFNFPEGGPRQDEPKESPEPRYLAAERPEELAQPDLRQLVLLANGLGGGSPAAMVQGRSAEERGIHSLFKKDKDNDKDHGGPSLIIIVPSGGGGGGPINLNNTVTNIANTTETGTGTTTRTGDFLRAPIGYPAAYPMQYFRKRGDEDYPMGYPAMYGWNEPSLYGGLGGGGLGGGLGGLGSLGALRGGYNGLGGGLTGGLTGGLNGGLNGGLAGGLSGLPLVPITIGNEVRYVPLNLRMFRQLVNIPVREKDDPLEEDDLTPFAAVGEQDADEAAANEEESANEDEAYASMSQRRRQRRKRPLQAFGQKIRQVQFL